MFLFFYPWNLLRVWFGLHSHCRNETFIWSAKWLKCDCLFRPGSSVLNLPVFSPLSPVRPVSAVSVGWPSYVRTRRPDSGAADRASGQRWPGSRGSPTAGGAGTCSRAGSSGAWWVCEHGLRLFVTRHLWRRWRELGETSAPWLENCDNLFLP